MVVCLARTWTCDCVTTTITITINSSQQDSEVYCVRVGGGVTVDEIVAGSVWFSYSSGLEWLIVDVTESCYFGITFSIGNT